MLNAAAHTIDLVIFDCDGTLIDSEVIAVRIGLQALAEVGVSLSAEEMAARFIGISWKDILLALEKETGLDLTATLNEKVEHLFDTKIPEEVEPVDGIHAVMATFPFKTCICSNSKMARLDATLAKTDLLRFFAPNIFSAKDLGPGREKPKPDVFLFAAEKMGTVPARTVVVEDSTHGVEAGCRANMRVIGYTGGKHSFPAHESNLRKAGAAIVISHMSELPAALTEIADLAPVV